MRACLDFEKIEKTLRIFVRYIWLQKIERDMDF